MRFLMLVCCCLLASGMLYAQQEPEQSTFSYQYGDLELGNGLVKLSVPQGFKFLDAAQSKVVIEDLWGNPPVQGLLGVLFPESSAPEFEDVYGFVIRYQKAGDINMNDEYVENLDYQVMLADMQQLVKDGNAKRVAQGYDSITHVGWASPPLYNAETHTLHFPKELIFSSRQDHMLNYDLWMLGGDGVLIMMATGTISDLAQVKADAYKIMNSFRFMKGYRYEDNMANAKPIKALAKKLAKFLLAEVAKVVFAGILLLGYILIRLFKRRLAKKQV